MLVAKVVSFGERNMIENTVDYVRCPICSYVYEATLDKCPNCQSDTVISESNLEEKVFNIID